jgi:outer membrane protein assembly factor BamB
MLAILLAAVLAAATPTFTATEVRRLPAAEAGQGVASGPAGLYAIDNRTIARLDPATGAIVTRWEGDAAHFKHINACIVRDATLVCAASNYPDVPNASRIETFDARTLRHLGTRELGEGHGSLTWALWHQGSWWLCYANYDTKSSAPGRDHRDTTLVRADAAFRERATWHFPDAVLERMTPRSASGGVFGADGLLYVTGHDRPELYALRVPADGGALELVATIAIPTGGQAIGWDSVEPRLLWSIERKTHEVVASRIPAVTR